MLQQTEYYEDHKKIEHLGRILLIMLERSSTECRKTKTKVIATANHKGHRQTSEPIKSRRNYMQLTQSAGKRA